MLDEGVIKFNFKLKPAPSITPKQYIVLERWRSILYKMKLIGEYPTEKIGYGNLSYKLNDQEEFLITGTQTGKYPNLNGSHYTKIVKCDLKKSSVEAIGPIAPSSETLTHFAIYSRCKQINAIFHIHDEQIWSYMIYKNLDSTSESVSYGTTEMGEEALKAIGTKTAGVFVMKGHKDGVIAYGKTPEEAGQMILKIFKQSRNE